MSTRTLVENFLERVSKSDPRLSKELRSIFQRVLENDPTGILVKSFLNFIESKYLPKCMGEAELKEKCKTLERLIEVLKLNNASSEQLAKVIPKLTNIRYYELSNVHVQKVEAKIFLGQAVKVEGTSLGQKKMEKFTSGQLK